MGTCSCKESLSVSDDDSFSPGIPPSVNSISSDHHNSRYDPVQHMWDIMGTKLSSTVDKLIIETLSVVGSLVGNDPEPPPSMTKLHFIADKENGWLTMVTSMVNVIPKDHPLGPAVISLLLDDCPLPTTNTVAKLSKVFVLSSENVIKDKYNNPTRHRNICITLGCIAEKLAGPGSVALLTPDTLNYLLTNLDPSCHMSVILFSLIALEKFAQTSVNKNTIIQQLEAKSENPLEKLLKFVHSNKHMEKEVGFCAQWSLDNLFIKKGRCYTYETLDRTNLNALLNSNDVSEYLKISPDGLSARCDASSFESVRCTFQVDSGVWYYEVTIITPGVMQIGWATRNSKFLNHEGYGIGDDEYSLAYDGCRQLLWHNAACYSNYSQNHPCWKPGDVLGSLIDLEKYHVIFYLNGRPIPPCKMLFQSARCGFFAAASFMSFQQCEFNFGRTPYKFPPSKVKFKSFNDQYTLTGEENIIFPRHIKLEKLRQGSVREDSCSLCFDGSATVRLDPCQHTNFCIQCALQLEVCPMCRSNIEQRVEIT